MFDGQNLWVFKPNDLNRGRGVNLFNSLEQLKKLLNDYSVGVEIVYKNYCYMVEELWSSGYGRRLTSERLWV